MRFQPVKNMATKDNQDKTASRDSSDDDEELYTNLIEYMEEYSNGELNLSTNKNKSKNVSNSIRGNSNHLKYSNSNLSRNINKNRTNANITPKLQNVDPCQLTEDNNDRNKTNAKSLKKHTNEKNCDNIRKRKHKSLKPQQTNSTNKDESETLLNRNLQIEEHVYSGRIHELQDNAKATSIKNNKETNVEKNNDELAVCSSETNENELPAKEPRKRKKKRKEEHINDISLLECGSQEDQLVTKDCNETVQPQCNQDQNNVNEDSNAIHRPPKNLPNNKGRELISDYIDRILIGRYGNKQKRVANALDSDSGSNTWRYGISDFETDIEEVSSSEASKAKMIEIISLADEELLNVLEENEQLQSLNIKISWDIPICHSIETRVSSCPTKIQKQRFKDLKVKVKNGPFTKREDEKIKENFQEFCTVHGLRYDPVPFLNFQYGKVSLLRKRQRINFVRYLGKGLNNRKLSCIYGRFKVLYSTFNKGRFTPEEDAVIVEYLKVANNNKNQFSSLSKILNRPRPSIEKRYKLLRRGSEMIRPKDYSVFLKQLMEVTNSNSLQDLKHKDITNAEWAAVARSLKVCKDHLKVCWESSLYTKLFHDGPINIDNVMRRLISKLDETGADDYRKLNWTKLVRPFENITRSFLYRMYKKTIRCKVPPHLHADLRKCVVYLRKLYAANETVMGNINNIHIKL